MYIQELIIDGFKSYAQKTVISGFDPQFNAITGLNGTGKSNILDAICFVLGISNLSQVRAGNLQELVYKQGQAGVTKASVTIIFNNSDPATSPVGYETHKQISVTRQVVIGGKNKYMINGHSVQQSQVQNLFHSVQLNVNNPHFLIMQGRITKVLNMKPIEILGMIEEAAGTRMFETKKQASIKTIEKKQLKVDEITKCIIEEITPTLDNLRSERQDYHTWQANNTEYERLERFCIASDFKQAEDRMKSADADRDAMIQEQTRWENIHEEAASKAAQRGEEIEEVVRRRDEEMEGELAELRKQEINLSKELVKINSTQTNLQENLSQEQENKEQLLKSIESTTTNLVQNEKSIEEMAIEMNTLENESRNAEDSANKMRERYQNACAGVADENTAELLSAPEQKVAWEKCEREASSKLQQCQQKKKHTTAVLAELKKSNTRQSTSHVSTQKLVERLTREVTEKENQLQSLGVISDDDERSRREELRALRQTVMELRDKYEGLNAQLRARLQFDYKDPEPRFDRSRVKGLVAELFTILPEYGSSVATALEVVAGGKLSQVVVDNEQTGKLLLQRGQLRRRVTILPLNKMNGRALPRDKVEHAQHIAASLGGQAHLALDLISFPPELRSVMQNVFGGVIICSTPEIAKRVAFDKTVRVKTVTLEGDSFDPSGTLTGGARGSLGTLLSKIAEQTAVRQSLDEANYRFEEMERQWKTLERQFSTAREVQSELELKREELRLAVEKLNDSDYSMLQKKISDAETELEAIESETISLKELQTKAKEELQSLNRAENDREAERKNKLKEFEEKVKSATKEATAAKAKLTKARSRRDILDAEKASLSEELSSARDQLEVVQNTITTMEKELSSLNIRLEQLKLEYDTIKSSVEGKSQELKRCNTELRRLEKAKEELLKESQQASLEARKISHQLKQWEKDSRDAIRAVAQMKKVHPWIETEKVYFGVAGTDYDFDARDVPGCLRRLKELKATQERLSRKLNKKVMGMIETAEAEYTDLAMKRDVILADKEKIERVIQELDVQKAQALQKTWLKVNTDFGSIFSLLLPGTTAKLEPPTVEGSTSTPDDILSAGLEVKVAFNGIWKASLTELSGGQRSLLALSLILALLLFKPAPMYILDEVDAALDLSHTQNIGTMLRTHFSASQFIVVSLKEGMFANANVLFRTRFVDGVSAVTRTVASSRGGRQQPVITNNEDEESRPNKRKASGR